MKTWGDIFYAALRRGDDHGYAAYLADRYMERHAPLKGETMPDSTHDTRDHIAKVRARIQECKNNLVVRAAEHDQSKFSDIEKPGYDKIAAAMAGLTYGTEAYKTAMAEVMRDPAVDVAWDHHVAVNTHHPEHYENGVAGMSLLDVLEMLCDWKGASERNGPSAFLIAYSIKGHNIDPQLAAILENTVKELGW